MKELEEARLAEQRLEERVSCIRRSVEEADQLAASGTGEGGAAFRDDSGAARARSEATARELEEAERELAEVHRLREALEHDPVVHLARAGGRERLREQNHGADEELRLRRQEERRRAASCTLLGFVIRTTVAQGLLGIAVFMAALWAVDAFTSIAPGDYVPSTLAGLAVGVPAFVVLRLGLLRWARRCLGVERAWIAHLPFAVTGYEALLADEYGVKGIKVLVTFREELSDRALLADAARGLGHGVQSNAESKTLWLAMPLGKDATGGACRAAFHRVVERLLLPAHGRYPIEHVSVSGS